MTPIKNHNTIVLGTMRLDLEEVAEALMEAE